MSNTVGSKSNNFCFRTFVRNRSSPLIARLFGTEQEDLHTIHSRAKVLPVDEALRRTALTEQKRKKIFPSVRFVVS